jgi:hypothetical protein
MKGAGGTPAVPGKGFSGKLPKEGFPRKRLILMYEFFDRWFFLVSWLPN